MTSYKKKTLTKTQQKPNKNRTKSGINNNKKESYPKAIVLLTIVGGACNLEKNVSIKLEKSGGEGEGRKERGEEEGGEKGSERGERGIGRREHT